MPINWKTVENQQRLVSALVASLDFPGDSKGVNYHTIAAIFGQDAGYDAIEGRFRTIRRDAEALKIEAISDGRISGAGVRLKPTRLKRATPRSSKKSSPIKTFSSATRPKRKLDAIDEADDGEEEEKKTDKDGPDDSNVGPASPDKTAKRSAKRAKTGESLLFEPVTDDDFQSLLRTVSSPPKTPPMPASDDSSGRESGRSSPCPPASASTVRATLEAAEKVTEQV